MFKKILIVSVFSMLGVLVSRNISFAKLPKQGQCFINHTSKEKFLTIKNNESNVIIVWYDDSGKISGIAPVNKYDIKSSSFNLEREYCPRFTMIHESTAEAIQAFGLIKDFQKAICLSRDINRRRNYELCETL